MAIMIGERPGGEARNISIGELTHRLGLPASDQSAVAAWTGEPRGSEWTESEAVQLAYAWSVDQARIAREG